MSTTYKMTYSVAFIGTVTTTIFLIFLYSFFRSGENPWWLKNYISYKDLFHVHPTLAGHHQ